MPLLEDEKHIVTAQLVGVLPETASVSDKKKDIALSSITVKHHQIGSGFMNAVTR